jgi:hypothetical protein
MEDAQLPADYDKEFGYMLIQFDNDLVLSDSAR